MTPFGYSQVCSLALLQLFALSACGRLFTAEFAGDAHEQTALAQKEAADVHEHKQQQQAS